MRIGVIGSRGLTIDDVGRYLPDYVSEIVSGGAKGVDASAAVYARKSGIRLTEFLPEYHRYGRAAPLKRNLQIVDYADEVIAFWDGSSKGTAHVIEHCRKQGVPVRIIIRKE